jgi:hypothetical protein
MLSSIINLRQFDEEHNNSQQTTSVMNTLAPTTNATSGAPKNQFHSLHHLTFSTKNHTNNIRISNARKQYNATSNNSRR